MAAARVFSDSVGSSDLIVRMKEIVSEFESSLKESSEATASIEDKKGLNLGASVQLLKSLERVWSPEVYLDGLGQRCSKLTFQVCFYISVYHEAHLCICWTVQKNDFSRRILGRFQR